MTLLTQKQVQDAVAFGGTLAAGRAEAGEIQGRVSRR
jgi:ADP-dependent phosphofructokinase/glucokinase